VNKELKILKIMKENKCSYTKAREKEREIKELKEFF